MNNGVLFRTVLEQEELHFEMKTCVESLTERKTKKKVKRFMAKKCWVSESRDKVGSP